MAEALGVELKSDLPEGYAVLEVMIVAKCLDENGEETLFQSASPGLRTWDAVGMATGLLDVLRQGLLSLFEPDDGS